MKTLSTNLTAPNLEIRFEKPALQPLYKKGEIFVSQGKNLTPTMLMLMAMVGEAPDRLGNIVPKGMDTEGVYLGDHLTFGMSPVTGKTIHSDSYNNCISFSAVGTEKGTGKQLGLQLHMVEDAPTSPLPSVHHGVTVGRKFQEILVTRLSELQEKSEPNTVDALFAGGRVSTSVHRKEDLAVYMKCIEMTDLISRQIIGRTATVLSPALGVVRRYISTDTQNRTVVVQPEMGQPGTETNTLFFAADVRAKIQELFS